jgi:hypothetical protein
MGFAKFRVHAINRQKPTNPIEPMNPNEPMNPLNPEPLNP